MGRSRAARPLHRLRHRAAPDVSRVRLPGRAVRREASDGAVDPALVAILSNYTVCDQVPLLFAHLRKAVCRHGNGKCNQRVFLFLK